jgi:hypothetical protein
MVFKQKKEALVAEFNRNQQIIQQLAQRNQQILGALQLIEDIEKTEEAEKEKSKEKK